MLLSLKCTGGMSLEAVIFDLDGVLCDTAQFHYLAWKEIAHEIGFELTQELNEQLKGVSRVDSLKNILYWAEKDIEQSTFDHLLETKNTNYLHFVDEMNSKDLFQGVPELLDELDNKGVRIGLGSASKNAKFILERLGILSRFEAISDGNNVVNGKPDPEVFLNAAKMLGVEPNKCLVIEDAPAGIIAANRAEMRSVGIGTTEVLGQADLVFEHVKELNLDILMELFSE